MAAGKLKVAEYLAQQIKLSGKAQVDIAADVGWPKPNMVTLVKQGLTRVPVEKAPALARSLGLDPAHFTRMVMREYMPATWEALESVFGEALTENERKLVFLYREVSGEEDIPIDEIRSSRIRAALEGPR